MQINRDFVPDIHFIVEQDIQLRFAAQTKTADPCATKELLYDP